MTLQAKHELDNAAKILGIKRQSYACAAIIAAAQAPACLRYKVNIRVRSDCTVRLARTPQFVVPAATIAAGHQDLL